MNKSSLLETVIVLAMILGVIFGTAKVLERCFSGVAQTTAERIVSHE